MDTAAIINSVGATPSFHSNAKAPRYVLRVTPKGRKFFHEVVDTESGRVIGTRTSNKHYKFATMVRDSLDGLISYYRDVIKLGYLADEAPLNKYLKMKADGVVPPVGVYSFNSKPTPLPSRLNGGPKP